jgi:hypothetical protein
VAIVIGILVYDKFLIEKLTANAMQNGLVLMILWIALKNTIMIHRMKKEDAEEKGLGKEKLMPRGTEKI